MAEKKIIAPKTAGPGKSEKSKPAAPAAKGTVSKGNQAASKSAAKAKPAASKSAAKIKPAASKIAAKIKPAAADNAVKSGTPVKKDVSKAKPANSVAKARTDAKTPVKNVVATAKLAAVPDPLEQAKKNRKAPVPVPSESPVAHAPRTAPRAAEDSADLVPATPRDHASIAKGIAERKAAAKAKSIARLSRPAVEKSKNLKKLTDKQSKEYEAMLLRLRDEISRQIAFLRGASLTRSDEVNPEEDGSDAFERQLALKLASNEGDAVFEIDEALHRIKENTYGVCQDCGCIVSPARLKALPFARRCVACKAVAEKNRDVNDRRYF